MKKLVILLFLFPAFLQAQKIVDISSMAAPGTALPTISTSVATLVTPFSTGQGTPSSSQFFTITASLLPGVGTATAGSGYEISLNDIDYSNTLTIPVTSGAFVSQPVKIYVRLIGTFVGSYNGFITIASGGVTKQVAVSGTVNSITPALTVTGTTTAFNTTAGTASTDQTVTVTGVNLAANCTVTPPAKVQCSLDGTTYTSPCTITQSGGHLVSEPVTVHLKVPASATAGAISGNVTFVAGAASQNLAVTGTVSSPSPDDTIQVNMTDGQSAASMHQVKWNNWSPTIAAATPQSSGVFNYTTGVASPITATVTQYTGVTAADYYDNTLAFGGGNTTGFPDTTFAIVFGWFDNGPDTLKLNNLPTATNNYSFILLTSRNTGFDRTDTITCNGVASTPSPFNPQNNTTTALRWDNVVKDGNSRIQIIFKASTTLQTNGNRAAGYLCAWKLIKHN